MEKISTETVIELLDYLVSLLENNRTSSVFTDFKIGRSLFSEPAIFFVFSYLVYNISVTSKKDGIYLDCKTSSKFSKVYDIDIAVGEKLAERINTLTDNMYNSIFNIEQVLNSEIRIKNINEFIENNAS